MLIVLEAALGLFKLTDAATDRLAHFGQFPRAEDDQSQDEDDDQLGRSDVSKHGDCSFRRLSVNRRETSSSAGVKQAAVA